MSSRAKVTSLEAIEAFRASLLIYLSKARPTLEEATGEVARTRVWLENNQRVHWEGQVRRRNKQLVDAQQALFSAELSNLRDATAAERVAVTRAKRAVEEAEEKLRLVKKWNREFGSRVEPLARQLERLHSVLAKDLPEAAAYLGKTIKTLHEYAEVAAPSVEESTPKPTANSSAVEAEKSSDSEEKLS